MTNTELKELREDCECTLKLAKEDLKRATEEVNYLKGKIEAYEDFIFSLNNFPTESEDEVSDN
jgi:predicted translin family RNA/ssDNA-binding protein